MQEVISEPMYVYVLYNFLLKISQNDGWSQIQGPGIWLKVNIWSFIFSTMELVALPTTHFQNSICWTASYLKRDGFSLETLACVKNAAQREDLGRQAGILSEQELLWF